MTKKQIFYRATVVNTIIVFAMAWLAGYDFDHRGPLIAVSTAISIFLILFVSKGISEILCEDD